MTMQSIPGIKYALSDDGHLINIEQGEMEPVYLQLHKIHVKHLAEVMKISIDEDPSLPMLVDYLERINEQATSLYELLKSSNNLSTKDIEIDYLLKVRKLMESANQALGYWGAN